MTIYTIIINTQYTQFDQKLRFMLMASYEQKRGLNK